MSKFSDSPWCEPNAPRIIDVFLVVFGDKKVSRIPESHVGIRGSWLVQASNIHVTTCILHDRVEKVYRNLKDNIMELSSSFGDSNRP
jgi:hypothetical protein